MFYWHLYFLRKLIIFTVLMIPSTDLLAAPTALHAKVIEKAHEIFNRGDISYVYGGNSLGDTAQCSKCNNCLEQKKPHSSDRLTECPQCRLCGLDCSHFISQIFLDAGLENQYLTTAQMLSLSKAKLTTDYHFADVGTDLSNAAPGDLLVYDGHVVMLEKLRPDNKGDIIHATGGRDLKGPGFGVQIERLVNLKSFRGPLLRLLRHTKLSAAKPGLKRAKSSGFRKIEVLKK